MRLDFHGSSLELFGQRERENKDKSDINGTHQTRRLWISRRHHRQRRVSANTKGKAIKEACSSTGIIKTYWTGRAFDTSRLAQNSD